MNSVRQNQRAKIWGVDDFIGSNIQRSQDELRIQSAEEILALMTKYMPPTVQ